MNTCEYAGAPFTEPRSHPWVDVAADPECRYYDFTASPALIRRVLEDFRPWSSHAAIETFYVLLEQLNLPGSAFESNDCAFTGPHANDQPMYPQALQCSGRVMVLFRDVRQNTAPLGVERLKNQLHRELAAIDPGLTGAIIGTTLIPVRYLMLPAGEAQLGSQLMISFWAWGDSEADTMTTLGRLFANLTLALGNLSARTARR